MRRILVIAPHADDETLGCGGTLLRCKAMGGSIHWLIVTVMEGPQFSDDQRVRRQHEIERVANSYAFDSVVQLDFPAARLDTVPMSQLVSGIGQAVVTLQPDTLVVPFSGDVHTDHGIVFNASAATGKWFRYPSVRRVLACEILSETDFSLNPTALVFRPNVYIDISRWLDQKVTIMRLYAGECGDHPFPRSDSNIRALATLRGGECGVSAAEAFMLLKETLK